MTSDRKWLARKLFEFDCTPPPIGEDVRSGWLNFTCEVEVAGEALATFVDDEDAARTVRDRLCSWAKVWSQYHPEPEWRPWYQAVAIAAEAENWEGVSRLCRALMEAQRRVQQ